MGISTVGKAWDWKHKKLSTTDTPRVKGSIRVRGNILLYFFALIEIWQI